MVSSRWSARILAPAGRRSGMTMLLIVSSMIWVVPLAAVVLGAAPCLFFPRYRRYLAKLLVG
jgi:hypothetical protein